MSGPTNTPESVSKILLELLTVAMLFIVVNAASAAYQRPISPIVYRQRSLGWDSFAYHRMTDQLSNGQRPQADAPFVYRLGTPWLAALVPGSDPVTGFRVVNLIANILAVILLGVLLRSYIGNWKIRTLLLALYIANWLAPTRFFYFMPVYTDPWDMVFVFAGFLVVSRVKDLSGRALLVAAITFVGVLFRENVLLLPVALILDWYVSSYWMRSTGTESRRSSLLPPPILFLPLAAGLLSYAATHIVASPANDYSYAHAAAFWALQKPLLGYLLAWIITFGPILGLVVFDWRWALDFLKRHGFFFGYLLGVAVLAWIGGATTERFVLWATPVVFVLLGRAMERHGNLLRSSVLFLAILAVAQILAYRLFWVVPPWPSKAMSPVPVFELLTNHAQYEDLWSWSLSIRIRSAYVLEYAIFVLGMVAWLHHRARKLSGVRSTRDQAPPLDDH